MSRAFTKALFFVQIVTIAFAVLTMSKSAHAHAVGLSSGEYTAQGATLKAKVALARGDAMDLVPGLDANDDRSLSPIEVQDGRALIEAAARKSIIVLGDGTACSGVLTDAALTEADGIQIEMTYTCAPPPARFELRVPFVEELARGHRHVARAFGASGMVDEMLYVGHEGMTIDPAAANANPAENAANPSTASPAKKRGTFFGFLKMGIEHILTGYDHMVFLFGLVLVRGRLRSLLAVITAFTIGHSISLALSVLDVWTPRPTLVEPAIALSIAYVGIENFFVKTVKGRWRITFPFGLVHGFGFAGALREIDIPRPEIPSALLSFNLGVEMGQLCVIAIVLPIVIFARQKPWFSTRGIGVKVLSGAVAGAGLVWFVARVTS